MNRKLLFFDIDGTLLAGGADGYIPESAKNALQQAQKNGHLCFINTGRTKGFLPDVIRAYPFDGYICGCGTEIILKGKTLYKKELAEELKINLLPKVHAANMQIVGEGPLHCYYEKRPDTFPELQFAVDFYGKIGIDKEPIKYYDESPLDFSKFIVMFGEDVKIDLFKEAIQEDFYYIQREHFGKRGFAEIVPLGCSKATGIDFLVDYYGLSLDDCYVFGDSNNDLSMLTHVKHSIAMGNSVPDILGQTEYITSDINDNGIFNALRHYGLI